MFSLLSERLSSILRAIGRKHSLSRTEFEAELSRLRIALLEADVNLNFARELLKDVREQVEPLLKGGKLASADEITRIVYETIVSILGGKSRPKLPTSDALDEGRILLLGIQGSGKTTTAAKLAYKFKRQGFNPLLVPLDLKRPAAREQLFSLASSIGVSFYDENPQDSLEAALSAIRLASQKGFKPLIFDSAGSLHIDERAMTELRAVKEAIEPCETLLVADAATGQIAVNIARSFHELIGISGVILTRVDSDARGGAALSILKVVGAPIKFIGFGESLEDLEEFDPEKWARRLLGLGDAQAIVQTVSESLEEEDISAMAQLASSRAFTLNEFLDLIEKIERRPKMLRFLEFVPGLRLRREEIEMGMTNIRKIKAIVQSMTPAERRNPRIVNARRKRRIARGSGTMVQDVNLLLRRFEEMQKALVNARRLYMGDAGKKR